MEGALSKTTFSISLSNPALAVTFPLVRTCEFWRHLFWRRSCDLLAERILNGLMLLKRTVKYPAFKRAFNSGNVKFSKRIQFDTVKS